MSSNASADDNVSNSMMENLYLEEFRNLRSEIKSLKKDVNKALEISGHRHSDALLMEMKGGLSRPVIQYMLADTKANLATGFDSNCKHVSSCNSAFSGLLQEMALLLLEDRVNETSLTEFRQRFEKLKEMAVFENCDNCLEITSRIFEKQMELIRSFNMSPDEDQSSMVSMNIGDISDEIVSQICEPLANKQRLCILRLLNSSARSFSDISKSTGLRGGNLLFHIQKLLDTGMILQRSERGDYMITRKGHMTLKGMAELFEKLSKV